MKMEAKHGCMQVCGVCDAEGGERGEGVFDAVSWALTPCPNQIKTLSDERTKGEGGLAQHHRADGSTTSLSINKSKEWCLVLVWLNLRAERGHKVEGEGAG